MPSQITEALKAYAETVHTKFSSGVKGEPEDQLRSPMETLLRQCGEALEVSVIPIGETLLEALGKPDFGIAVDKLLCGHLELKAPGKGAEPKTYTGHDAKQWLRFAELPNIIYSDGIEWSLFRQGERKAHTRLAGDPRALGAKAVDDEGAKGLERLLRDYLAWEPIVPGTSKQLAAYLAPLCRVLRDDVFDALRNKAPGVTDAAKDWRRYLFPGADDARFADDYAQTVTFALLLARSNGSDTLFLDEAIESLLDNNNTLLSRALEILTDTLVQEQLSTSLSLLQRVIAAVPTGTMSGGRRDPWLHFYEDFLAEYDPTLRKDAGAYYTPVEVVQAQVRIVDQILTQRMKKPLGFAEGGINVLDPAVGTGTYLLGIVEHAMERIELEEGKGSVPARASLLAGNLYGFEIMVSPYAVSALRLTRMLHDHRAGIPGDGVQIMLNNTLESPLEKIPEIPLLYKPIGVEHHRARRVKETVPILVCIGNPPYDRHAAATDETRAMTGAWVRWGEAKDGKDAILTDIIEPVKAAGKGGDLKNLYNLYIYFWRWALWKTFEHELAQGSGVVSYITAASFIDGSAFLGLRKLMRELCDEIWVIDLGGEGRGTRREENVFAIQTPVAITVAVRYGRGRHGTPAKVHYCRIGAGTRKGKLELLDKLEGLDDFEFADCPEDWGAPFRPAGHGDFFAWPLLADLMPWQQSGVKAGRNWVISASKETLEKRFCLLTRSPIEERKTLFKDSPTGRKISDKVRALTPTPVEYKPIIDLSSESKMPERVLFCFRSFDRQALLADGRFIDRSSPPLWLTQSNQQIYLGSLSTQPLGSGPGVMASTHVPDLHFFRGSFGAKDIFPLYRDAAAAQPNLHPDLLVGLEKRLGRQLSPEDFVAYTYAMLAQPTYTERFFDELNSREVRVPITLDGGLFEHAITLGRELLFLHTFGERFAAGQSWPEPVVKCHKPVPSGELPETFDYDEERRVIDVGGGEFGPVSPEIWNYEVSGLKVVQSWLDYRMRKRKGKASSPLDEIRPAEWPSEFTSELLRLLNLLTRTLEIHSEQAELLDAICAGDLLQADDLADLPPAFRKAPKPKPGQGGFGY